MLFSSPPITGVKDVSPGMRYKNRFLQTCSQILQTWDQIDCFCNYSRMESVLKNKMNYPFEETPSQRRGEGESLTTTEMIKQITRWRNTYNNPQLLTQKQMKDFAKFAAVDFVHNLNKGEMVGTQTWEDTQEVIEEVLKYEGNEQNGKNKEYTETLNNFKAMKHLFDLHQEMDKSGLITVQQINKTHGILLNGLHKKCGEIRKKDVFTRWNGNFHKYPAHEEVEGRFYALIDHHTQCMQHLESDDKTEEYTANIFKCAARLMFEFVDTHPYLDGNGRMCRLLANYVLGRITPFPVAIYHCAESRCSRDDYIDAIVHCRDHPEEGPRALAAMLVEGAWCGWKKLDTFRVKSCETSMVIKKSVFREQEMQYTYDKLSRIWPALEMKGTEMTREEVIEIVIAIVSALDTTSLAGSIYIETRVQLETDVYFFLHVYN